MLRKIVEIFGLVAAVLLVAACDTVPPTASERSYQTDEVQAAISRFRTTDPAIGHIMDSAYGYAVFPSVGKGAIGIGGAYGRGQAFQGGKMVGYCDLSQGTIGLALGGQEYREIVIFQDKGAFDRFTRGEFALAAQATAVAAKAGSATDADFKDGVMVFTDPVGGLMFEASVGGQNFGFVPAGTWPASATAPKK
jgi:lipid-binding SYLF domain-containing protein